MVKGKRAYEEDFAIRVTQLERRLWSSIKKQEQQGQMVVDDQAFKQVKTAKEEIEALQILHPDKIKYPV